MTINMALQQLELTSLKPTKHDNKYGIKTTGTNRSKAYNR